VQCQRCFPVLGQSSRCNFNQTSYDFVMQTQKTIFNFEIGSRIKWCLFALIFGYLGLLFLSLSVPFYYDDFTHILNAEFLRHLPQSADDWRNWAYRPVLSALYAIEIGFGGPSASAMRLVNGLIHLANCFLLWRLLRSRVQISQSVLVLLISIVLFHPILWHPILYVSARSTLLVAFFTLLSLNIFSKHKILCAISVLLAIATKETGMLAPCFIGLFHYSEILQIWRNRRIQMVVSGALVTLVLFLGLWFRRKTILDFFDMSIQGLNYPHTGIQYLKTQGTVVWQYLYLFLNPSEWAFIHEVKVTNDHSWGPLVLFAILFVIILVVFIKRWNYKTVWFFLLAGLLGFLPEMIYPRELTMIEQRCYLPFLFFTAALISGIVKYESRINGRWLAPAAVLIFCVYGFLMLERVAVYQSPIGMHRHDWDMDRHNIQANMYLGQEYLKSGNVAQAIQHFGHVVDTYKNLRPISGWYERKVKAAYSQLVLATINGYGAAKAVEVLKNCQDFMEPERCQFLNAQTLYAEGKYSQAIEILESLPFENATYRYELVRNYLSANQDKKGLAYLQESLKKYPFDVSLVSIRLKYLFVKKDFAKAKEFIRTKVSELESSGLSIDDLRQVRAVIEQYSTELNK
jgi:hypothetical protein